MNTTPKRWKGEQADRLFGRVPTAERWKHDREALEAVAHWMDEDPTAFLDQLRDAGRGYSKSRRLGGTRSTSGVYTSPTEAAVLGHVAAEDGPSDDRWAAPDPDEQLLGHLAEYQAAIATLVRCQRLLGTGAARRADRRREEDCLRCLADVQFRETDGSRCKECHGTGSGNKELLTGAGNCICCGDFVDGGTETTRLKGGLDHKCYQSWLPAKARGVERGEWLARRRSELEAK